MVEVISWWGKLPCLGKSRKWSCVMFFIYHYSSHRKAVASIGSRLSGHSLVYSIREQIYRYSI